LRSGSCGRRVRAYVQAGWTSLVFENADRLRFKDRTVSGVEHASPSVLDAREVEDEARAWWGHWTSAIDVEAPTSIPVVAKTAAVGPPSPSGRHLSWNC